MRIAPISLIAYSSFGNILITFTRLLISSFSLSKQLFVLRLLLIVSLVKYAKASSNPSSKVSNEF